MKVLRCLRPTIVCQLALLNCLAFAQAARDADPQRLPTPVDLLNESHLLGEQLLPSNRCFLYFQLAMTAAKVSPPLGKDWALELFALAQQLPASWNRAALRKNAIQVLADVDPARAFAMIPEMDPPSPMSGDFIPEDLRAYVAGRVYPLYWAQQKSEARRSAIRAQAAILAVDGQYPFGGVQPVLEDLERQDRQAAEAWWTEIVRFYPAGDSRIRDTDEQFVVFLESTWKIAPAWARKDALQKVVKQLLNRPADGDASKDGKGTGYQAIASTSIGVLAITDPAQALLAQILPLIRDSAPGLMDDIVKRNPSFARAKESGFEVMSVSGATVYASQGGQAAAQAGAAQLAAEQSIAEQVQKLAAKDPSAALQMAMNLKTLQNFAFDRISDALPDATQDGTSSLAREAAKQLDTVQSKRVRLNLLVLQAASAQSTKPQVAEAALREGFTLGAALVGEYSQTHPLEGPDEAPAMPPLQRLVRIGIRFSPRNTLGYLRQTGDTALQAWLLIDAAEASKVTATKAPTQSPQ